MVEHWNDEGEYYDSLNDPSLLDYEEDAEFCEWYSTEGSARISELSRQLRTFLNYKCAVIRARFSRERKDEGSLKKDPIMTLKNDLFSFCSRYTTLLNMIGVEGKTVTEKILILMARVKAHKKEFEINLLRELRQLGDDMWKIIHVLSECELHQHLQLLNITLKIAGILCSAESAIFWTFLRFYEELKLSYRQLDNEMSGLVRKNDEMQFNAKEKERKVKILK